MGKIIEGVWDCVYCDTKRIRGSLDRCPVCGKTRGIDTKFYIADPKNYVDEEKAKKISKNPDWLCSFCDSLNSDNINICPNCGATRTESEKNYFTMHQKDNKNNTDSQHNDSEKITNDTDLNKHTANIYQNSSDNNNYSFNEEKVISKKKNFKSILPFCIPIGAIIALIALFTFLLLPKNVTATVDSFSWERTITIEEYKTVEESDWSLPSTARLQYQQREIRSYNQVIDHYETKTRTYTEQVIDHYETRVTGHRDLGNGYFEEITQQVPVYRTETKTETYEEPVYRQEPVYDTKYYYEIDKWVLKNKEKSEGNDKSPYWPKFTLNNNERQGERTSTYYIYCTTSKDKQEKYTVKEDVWESLNIGDVIKLKVDAFGKATIINKTVISNESTT